MAVAVDMYGVSVLVRKRVAIEPGMAVYSFASRVFFIDVEHLELMSASSNSVARVAVSGTNVQLKDQRLIVSSNRFSTADLAGGACD